MYDEIFRLDLPERVKLVGFADDVAVVTVAKHVYEIEATTNEAIARIKRWLSSMNLELADHKTEALLITGRKKVETMTIQVGREQIKSGSKLKYLGVMLDNRLNFKSHVDYCSEKAAKIQTALSRIMPNIVGPKQERRMLLTKVVSSVLLYAAPIWAKTLTTQDTRRKITTPYRISALRAISGFRTISDEAAFVLAGMIPIDILADEMRRIYHRRKNNDPSTAREIKTEERETSKTRWQTRWETSTKGRWTNRMIPIIDVWTDRTHGTCNYNLTQFLSGHGGYRKYLNKFGHDDSAECPSCEEQEEDAEHVMFNCDRFDEGKDNTRDPTNIVENILQSQDCWDEFCKYVTKVHTELRRIEKIRRAASSEVEDTA